LKTYKEEGGQNTHVVFFKTKPRFKTTQNDKFDMWQEGEEGKVTSAIQVETKTEKKLDLGQLVPTKPMLLDPKNLEKLEPIFREGRQGELDPIVIIRDPDSNELLLEDGNNRTALAIKYGVEIPYKVYEVGETHSDSG